MNRSIIHTSALIVAILAGPLLVAAQTWTAAPANPPSSNASAPINVSGSNQLKAGGLQVGSFVSDGGAAIAGDASAARFCLPGAGPSGGCISTWPSGGGGGGGTITLTPGPGVTINGGATTVSGDTFTITTSATNNTIIQSRISGTCSGQVMVAVNQDGTVACEPDDSGGGGGGPATVTVSTSNGITVNGGTLVTGSVFNLANDATILNTSGTNQYKVGGLQVGSLVSDGGAQVGSLVSTGGGTFGNNVDVSGHSVTASAYYYVSDNNLKNNIVELSDSLSKVLQLKGVSFNWKDSGKASVGVIAQDVEKVYPDLVSTDPKTGLKSVEYGNLVAPLIEAIKAQQKQIDALKAEVQALKK